MTEDITYKVWGGYVFGQMQPKNYLTAFGFYAIAAIYVVIRNRSVKKAQGKGLFEIMRTSYTPWDEQEARAAAMLRANSGEAEAK